MAMETSGRTSTGPLTPMLSPTEKGGGGGGILLNVDGSKRTAPDDRYRAVYLIFYLLGLGTLLPWNFFITAQGYWTHKFRDVERERLILQLSSSSSHHHHHGFNETLEGNQTSTLLPPFDDDPNYRSDLQKTFTSYLSVCSMVPNTIFLMLNTILSRRIPLRIRLVGSLTVIIVLFILTTILVKTETDEWQTSFFSLTLLTVVFLNCMTAIFQGALFGVAAIFPAQITQAIMNGQALGGVFASVASIVSLLGGSSDVDSAFSYFLAAVATLVISIAAYLNLTRFEYYNYYMGQDSDKGTDLSPGNRSKSVPFFYIFGQIKVHAISVSMVFAVTLAVFPAVTVLVVSGNKEDATDWNKKYFIPVGVFLIYNLGDYMGRMAAGWHDLPKTRFPLLPTLCALRLCFIPLLMLCNAQPRKFTSAVFTHDAYFLFFMIVFSLSGGYLASQAMIHGPKGADLEHQASAGAMMAFFLGFGLMLGSALSNAFVRLL